jgi:type VI secretion system protein ImpL
MTSLGWLWIAFSAVAALIFAALIWFAGPIIFIGETQPLAGVGTRLILIAIVLLVVFGVIAWRVISRRRAAAALEKAMTDAVVDDSDAPILKGKMEDALATLKRSNKSSAGALYDLPWYLIIGPPGAGKTTALINSGLKFPLAGDSAARAVQGVGGTRYCDWWFSDDAVLIDTAGRYTTQDSDARVDRKSWLSFLALLRTNRPRQPINGVIVAISIADVLGLGAAEVNAHADAIRKRLDELHDELKVSFPVYAIFTKMDLIAGFTQYFADLDEEKRKAVWGATFQTADKRANNVGKMPEEMDLLIQRISERMAERLQDEPDLRSRAMLYGLPAQLAAIRKPVADFLNRIFEPTRYQTTATLRGFYFTSGTQEGTPFDAVVGALRKSYGVESLGAERYAGPGKSYFLHDLLVDVIFGEAGWVSTNIAAVRRNFVTRLAAFTLIALATAGILTLWWISYDLNSALIAATESGVDSYASAAAPVIKASPIKDSDLRQIYSLVDTLPELPVGYAHRKDPTPLGATFGLGERSRVQDASIDIYQQALERMLRPRLIVSLEKQIRENIDDPIFVYEALKVYLMLGGKAPILDKPLVMNWFQSDWEERAFRGGPDARVRDKLAAHLQAMLDLQTDEAPKIKLDGALVEQARATLSRMRLAERAYTLLKTEARNAPLEDWVASQRGGPSMALVFETANKASLDTVRVSRFYTYEGFYICLLDRMPTIAETLQKEKWVLGPAADQKAIDLQYSNLFPDILDLYGKDFVAAWNVALANLQLRPLLADKPKYLALAAASAPTSPITTIFESIRDETALTRERKATPASGNGTESEAKNDLLKAAKNRLSTTGRTAMDLAIKSQLKAGEAPRDITGAAIEANFKEIIQLVDGPPRARPIDSLIENLSQLNEELHLAATNPLQSKQAVDQAEVKVAELQGNVTRLPQPLKGWIDKVARDAMGDATTTSVAQLGDALAQNVTAPCQQIVNNHYPFSAKGSDVPLGDFSRLFMPSGLIDRFFMNSLAPWVNATGKTWTWRGNPGLTRKLSDTTLHQFQMAAEIRDALFPTGGSQPNLNIQVKLLTLNSTATSASLTVGGGAPIVSQLTPNTPAALQWPGAGAGGASITLAPDVPDQKSTIEREGPWALFRLVDAGAVTSHGNSIKVGFIVGARDVAYEFTVSTTNNPLSMPSLRQFKCPNGL